MTETITCPADIPAGLSRLRRQDSHRGLDRRGDESLWRLAEAGQDRLMPADRRWPNQVTAVPPGRSAIGTLISREKPVRWRGRDGRRPRRC